MQARPARACGPEPAGQRAGVRVHALRKHCRAVTPVQAEGAAPAQWPSPVWHL
jgi:hypothetical protein